MKKIFTISSEIYKNDFLITIDGTAKIIFNFLKKNIKYKLNEEEIKSIKSISEYTKNGTTIQLRGGPILINIKTHKEKSEMYSTICHECVHATNMLFERKGIELDYNNDEAFAYFSSYLSKKIFMEIL